MNLYNAHLVGRVVAEEHLRVGIFYAIASIVRTTINLATIVGGDGEVIWYVDTIVHQLCLDILVEESEVDAFLQWFLRSLVEDVVNFARFLSLNGITVFPAFNTIRFEIESSIRSNIVSIRTCVSVSIS